MFSHSQCCSIPVSALSFSGHSFLHLMIVERQWNAVQCLITQSLVQNNKWTREELFNNWLLIGLRSNQLWHTLCKLRCSSKVLYWKTILI